MPSAALALFWSLLAGPIVGVHADGAQLRAAARAHGVPSIVMEAVAAVESGYRGGNDWRGAQGEVGRLQIKQSTARLVGCGRLGGRLEDYGGNLACGARILRYCRARYGSWTLAIRCYQGLSLPPATRDYLAKVEREIGRMMLTQVDLGPPLLRALRAREGRR